MKPDEPQAGDDATRARAESVRAACPLFQAGGGGSTPTSALSLTFGPINLDTAAALNALWHSRLPRIDKRVAGWTCFAADFDGLYYAACIWGLPVARMLPQDGSVLELRRLAIAPDAPRNTASRMLGWMVRVIRKSSPDVQRLVSYQDTEVHTGGIYKAAGWSAVAVSRYVPWKNNVRPSRPEPQTTADKVRWEKTIITHDAPGAE